MYLQSIASPDPNVVKNKDGLHNEPIIFYYIYIRVFGIPYFRIQTGAILISMIVNKDFQTWHLTGWQKSRQPIRSYVIKALLTNMEFNLDFA